MSRSDLQSGRNNSAAATFRWSRERYVCLPPRPDMRTMVESAARYVAKNGLEYEKSITDINDEIFDFLRSSSHPLHGYYQHKLTEYLSKNQEEDGDDVAITHSTEFIEPPPGRIRIVIEGTARYISKMGLEAERKLLDFYAHDPTYNFVRMSDPLHAFFQQKLTEYRSQNQQDGANQDDSDEDEGDGDAQPDLVQPQFIVLPNFLQFRLPEGMKLKQFDTMKLTAQFSAWYGSGFWVELKRRAIPGFEFTKATNIWFTRFTQFVVEYSKVLTPPKDLKEKLRKSDAYTAAILEGFFRLLQWDALQEMKWREGGVMSMVNWHASLETDFAHKEADEELPPPGTGTGTGMSSRPPPEHEPEPKRQKFDGPALVPEDQFLAQHPGSSTIRVSFVNVIEITVQSLSETVACLKEKIAGEIQIPSDRLKLSGKAGFLEEENRSLAHYNVGAGDILTLSL